MQLNDNILHLVLLLVVFVSLSNCDNSPNEYDSISDSITNSSMRKDSGTVFLKEEISFPISTAHLIHKHSKDTIYSAKDCRMELMDSNYLLVLNPVIEELKAKEPYYWLLVGYDEKEIDSTHHLILSNEKNISLKVISKAVEEILVKVPIAFKPQKVGLELSKESLPSRFWNQKIYAAKWERTGAEKHYYCLPRSGEKLIITGTSPLTSNGIKKKVVVNLPKRTHYFQFYAILLKTSTSYPLRLKKSINIEVDSLKQNRIIDWWNEIKEEEKSYDKLFLEGKNKFEIISCGDTPALKTKVKEIELLFLEREKHFNKLEQLEKETDCNAVSPEKIRINYYSVVN